MGQHGDVSGKRVPDTFSDNLDESGDGCIIIRYGGKRITVIVKLCSGWRKLIKHAHVISGATLLVAHSYGNTISTLKFKRGMGVKSAWDMNADVFTVDSQLLDEDEVPSDAVTRTYRTSYFPPFIALFFASHSVVSLFENSNDLAMVMFTIFGYFSEMTILS
ncbi:hypothetical protein LIER_38415 [Lithospermum erythrorhizon]|uniref:Uncharacterized protein n=1 Tax=Lithospermum erythrorhizon TaxID=34254 RepID=A0AAV3Q0G2_LITER